MISSVSGGAGRHRLHAQGGQISVDIVEHEEGGGDEGDHAPPTDRQVDQRVLPEEFVLARFAEVALDGVGEPHHQRADVLVISPSRCFPVVHWFQ